MLSKKLSGKRIILASKSPRRQELLKGLNIPFEIMTKEVDESFPDSINPTDVAQYLAELKAEAFEMDLKNDAIIITADTVVISEGKILGKPSNSSDSRQMLNQLSNRSHNVITGVCIKSKQKTVSFSVSTMVQFKSLSSQEIDYYIAQYKPFDKAGSYGIQEWIGYIGIPKIEGSYFNVMGLPVYELNQALLDF